jgi:hypothetical protein
MDQAASEHVGFDAFFNQARPGLINEIFIRSGLHEPGEELEIRLFFFDGQTGGRTEPAGDDQYRAVFLEFLIIIYVFEVNRHLKLPLLC